VSGPRAPVRGTGHSVVEREDDVAEDSSSCYEVRLVRGDAGAGRGEARRGAGASYVCLCGGESELCCAWWKIRMDNAVTVSRCRKR
jgi:hypothetical protein